MGKRLSDKNPFLRDPEKKKRLMVSAITSSQRQEGIDISDARAEEVYKIVFEEPPVAFFRLTQAGDDREQEFAKALVGGAPGVRFDVRRRDLLAVDGGPLLYWIPQDILRLFRELPKLAPTVGRTRSGLNTTEIHQFVRFRWEVRESRKKRWVLFAKGGEYSRFYADWDLVFDWTDDGREFKALVAAKYGSASRFVKSEEDYFSPGITWMQTTNLGMNARVLPGEGIFGVASPTLFLKDASDRDVTLALMNSSMFDMLARCVAIRNWGATAIGSLPAPLVRGEARTRLEKIVSRVYAAKIEWDQGNEISAQYREPWLATELRAKSTRSLAATLDALLEKEAILDRDLQALYGELDELIFDAYGLTTHVRAGIVSDLGSRPPEVVWPQMNGKAGEQKRMEHVVRLLSFCVKRILEADDDGIVPLVACNNEPPLEERVLAELGKLVGADRAHVFEGEIASELRKKVPGYKRADSIGDFLANAYFEHHARLYKSRPIFWHLASSHAGSGTPAFAVLAHYHRFRKDALRKLRGTYVRSFIERRERDLAQARKANKTDEALEIQQGIEEAQAFDKKLQDLEEGRPAIRVPWKKANEQPRGWDPDIDDGVKVNILPLQTAGLLRIAKVVSTRGGEEDEV
jgi:hypothetical protein